MTTFVDYAWWQVSPAQLRTMGFSGALRYLSHDPSKDLSALERDNLRAAGFDIGLVCESVSNRAAQGVGAGHDDSVFYNQRADALGYPKSAVLFAAVDFDAAPSQVQPYFDGWVSAGGRPVAPYGGIRVVDGVRYSAPFAWQTAAWSGGQVSKRAGVLQNGFHDTYDSNTVLVADFGQWRAGNVQEDDLQPDERIWLSTLYNIFNGGPVEPGGPSEANALIEDWRRLRDLVPVVQAIQADVSSLKAGGGQVDVGALAKAVADELERRLAG